MSKYKLNCYTCQKCSHVTTTIDRDTGVTPFMIGCTIDGCEGMAQSSMYNVNPLLQPTHEWYKADNVEQIKKLANEQADEFLGAFKEDDDYQLRVEGLIAGMVDHYESGGLELREIKE